MRYNTPSAEQRQKAVAEARAAGRQGAQRVPDTALFGHGELSDTALIAVVDGLFEGRAEREASGK